MGENSQKELMNAPIVSRFHIRALVGLIVCSFGSSDSKGQMQVEINPGPVGATFAEKDLTFTNLNGIIATGQTLEMVFVFPQYTDAEYITTGARGLYGWGVNIFFSGDTTVLANPGAEGTTVLGDLETPIAPVPTVTIGDGSSGSVGYFSNFNVESSEQQLINFTGVPYHAVEINVRLPAFAGTNTLISGASFEFNSWSQPDENGDQTKIISSSFAPPTLTVTPMGSNAVLITWLGNPTNYALQQIPMLGKQNWSPNTNAVNSINGTNQVIVSPLTDSMFFRLVQQ